MDLLNLVGQTLGSYELLELIGRGGMSAVYRAHQPSLNRDVAVKVLSASLAADPAYAQRFDHEAKTIAKLEHNNIIPVYDYGTQDGLSYIAMRLLTGGTLGERVEYRVDHNGPLPSFGEAALLAQEMAKALSYAHKQGVIHRDIKASNVMFDGQGDPYLVDFGIAQVLQANIAFTAENQTIGTPTYMAPEQWRDEDLTPATDQYALAVLLFYTLTGRLPFYGSNPPALMQKHLNDAPPAVHTHREGLPEAVSGVLQRALSKDPANRYDSVNAFADAFEAALGDNLDSKTNFFHFSLDETPNIDHNAPTAQAPTPPAAETLPAVPPATPPEEYNPAPLPRTASEQPAPVSTPPTPGYAPRPTNSFIRGAGIGLVILVILAVIMIAAFTTLFSDEQEIPTPVVVAVTETSAPTDTPPAGVIRINPDATQITPVRAGTAVAAAPVTVGAGRVLYVGAAGDVVRSIDVNPAGVVFSGHADGTIRGWFDGTGSNPTVLNQHSRVVNAIDMSEDGTVMISGSDDWNLRVWNGQTGEYLGALEGHTSAVRGVAVSPDGTLAASASEDRSARLWDIDAGTEIATLRQGNSRFLDVDFSPDGSLVAAGEESGIIYLYNVETRSLLRTLRGHTESVRSVNFSPDGTQLLSASTDNTIRIWNVDSGSIAATLRGHNNDVWRAVYSPDGNLIASGGRDNALRLWNAESGEMLASFDDHEAWVLGMAFTPDGEVLVSGGGDGSVRTWAVEE